jgi:hypothetical protein
MEGETSTLGKDLEILRLIQQVIFLLVLHINIRMMIFKEIKLPDYLLLLEKKLRLALRLFGFTKSN